MLRKILLILMVMAALGVVQTLAQEENSPPQVGLRPDAPQYAVHGPYWVGTMEFTIEDPDRPLPVTLWYPALNESGAENYAVYDMGIGDLTSPEASTINEGHALTEATPALADAPYPLVIISHGLGGTRFGYYGLSEHLASHGFVVIAVEHVGTAVRDFIEGTADIGDKNNILSLYYRPFDIVRTIAYADSLTATDGPLAGLINTEQIAVWGHSTGGTTVLQAGGARVDFDALSTWCTGKGTEEFAVESCQFVGHEDELAALYNVDRTETELFPPLWDTRVDAIVAAAPGGELHAFGDAGINAINLPTLIMFGTLDPFVSPEYNAYWAYNEISSPNKVLVTFENGGHLMFADCPAAWQEFCGYDSVWDLPRVADLESHFTTTFLLDVLTSDQEAHAALAPEAVQFPGITYEAEGY